MQANSGTYPEDMGTARSTNRTPRIMLGDLGYTDGDGAMGCDGGREGTSIRGGFVMNGYLKFYVQIRCTIWLFIVLSSPAGDAHEFLEFGAGDGLVALLSVMGLDALDDLLGGTEGFPGDDHHVLGVDENPFLKHDVRFR